MKNIPLFTTPIVEGHPIKKYLGIVTADQVAGTGFLTDFIASVSFVFGGNSDVYREEMDELCGDVIKQLTDKAEKLGANAIVGVDINYANIPGKGMAMFMISIEGTAVVIDNISEVSAIDKKDVSISWKQLNYEYRKNQILGLLNDDDVLSNNDWDFILENKIAELKEPLYKYFLKCKNADNLEDGNAKWVHPGISNYKKYLSILGYDDAVEYAYRHLDEFKHIIESNKLFNAKKILEIAKSGDINLAISLLSVEKKTFNRQDLEEMKELSTYLQNLPVIVRSEEVEDNQFSSDSSKNAKGITMHEQKQIEKLKGFVEVLSDLLK